MAQNPNSLKNLTHDPNAGLTPEQMSERARKAQKASAKARRENRNAQERINYLLNLGVEKGKVVDCVKALDEVSEKNVSVMDKIIEAQIVRAMDGNTKAAEFLMEYAGMKPVEKKEIKASIKTEILDDIMSQLEKDDEDEK